MTAEIPAFAKVTEGRRDEQSGRGVTKEGSQGDNSEAEGEEMGNGNSEDKWQEACSKQRVLKD